MSEDDGDERGEEACRAEEEEGTGCEEAAHDKAA